MSADATTPLLSIQDLHLRIRGARGDVFALQGVDLDVPPGRVVALVGESGCGKSLTARAALGLLPEGDVETRGRVLVAHDGGPTDLLALPRDHARVRALRWSEIAMVFQEPGSALSPVHSVGEQIAETVRLHQGASRRAAWSRAVEVLRDVRLPDPAGAAHAYPFQLSGGMRQRAAIAMALACEPALLVADEPTTALDVTLQAQVLDLLLELQAERGMAMLLITHDLGVVSHTSDDLAVMYLGRVVERGPTRAVLTAPHHPYTRALLASTPHARHAPKTPLPVIPGRVPTPSEPSRGCSFAPRCELAVAHRCTTSVPPLAPSAPKRAVACVHRGLLEAAA